MQAPDLNYANYGFYKSWLLLRPDAFPFDNLLQLLSSDSFVFKQCVLYSLKFGTVFFQQSTNSTGALLNQRAHLSVDEGPLFGRQLAVFVVLNKVVTNLRCQ
jgi:hypothetical protein